MADAIASGLWFGYLAFSVLMAGFGLFVLWLGLMQTAKRAIEKTLEVAALVEAIQEAHRQGRAPLFCAWLRWLDRGQNK